MRSKEHGLAIASYGKNPGWKYECPSAGMTPPKKNLCDEPKKLLPLLL